MNGNRQHVSGRSARSEGLTRVTDPRGFLLVTGLVVTLLAGDFSIPQTDIGVRYILIPALGLLAITVRPQNEPRPIGPLYLPIIAWTSLLALSALWSPNREPVGYVIDLLMLTLIVLLTVHAARTVEVSSLDLVWLLFLLAGVAYLFLALAFGPTAQGRLSVPGGGPNVFVRVMLLAGISAFVLAFKKKVAYPLWLIPLFAVGALLSGSRGGLLGGLAIACLAVIPLFLSLRGGTRVLILAFGLGISFVGWNAVRDTAPVTGLIDFVRDRYIDATLIDGYASGRDLILAEGWAIFRENIVSGAGLGAWEVVQSTGINYVHPHNIFLSSGVDAGVIGVLLLCVALAVPTFAAFSRRPVRAGTWASLSAALAVLVSALFSGYYYDSRLLWFFLIWAVAYAVADSNSRPDVDASEHTTQSGAGEPVGSRH